MKSLEELLFETYTNDRVIKSLAKLWNAEISQATLLVVSSHYALIAILNTQKDTFVMESVFSIVIGDRLDSLNCLQKTFTKDAFLGIFWNFQSSSFSEHPLKNVWSDFFICFKILNSNLVTLTKWFHYIFS